MATITTSWLHIIRYLMQPMIFRVSTLLLQTSSMSLFFFYISAIENEYVLIDAQGRIKTEAYYCTEVQNVKGILTVRTGVIFFDPI